MFVFLAVFAMTGCSEDDDALNVSYQAAEIVDNDLPESFEFGKIYEITVSYVLPTRCHQFLGLDAQREGVTGDARRNIFVAAIAVRDENVDCEEGTGGNLGTTKFSLTIDEEEDYTFNFLVGEENDEPIYETVVVPVIDTDTN